MHFFIKSSNKPQRIIANIQKKKLSNARKQKFTMYCFCRNQNKTKHCKHVLQLMHEAVQNMTCTFLLFSQNYDQ